MDNSFARAVRARGRARRHAGTNMFWGDGYGKLTDSLGQQRGMATHQKEVAREELARRPEAFFAKSARQG